MPVHKIPRARLHEDVSALERDHEVIVSTEDAGDGCVWVFTRWCGQTLEVRPAMSVAATVAEHRYAGGDR
jgi:hypothetical protein